MARHMGRGLGCRAPSYTGDVFRPAASSRWERLPTFPHHASLTRAGVTRPVGDVVPRPRDANPTRPMTGRPAPLALPDAPPATHPDAVRPALARALRTHLLPLIDGDLAAVAARTGVNAETLRKYATHLRKPEPKKHLLPSADTLVAVLLAYRWSLERLLDPTCDNPAVPPEAAATAPAAAGVLSAHAATVLRNAAGHADDPDARAIPQQPDVLLRLFTRAVVHLHGMARAERARRRAADLERRCQAAAERLAREDVVWDAAAGAPALGLSVALYAGRLRRALQSRTRDEVTGEPLAGAVVVSASDPWALVQDLLPSIERLLAGDAAIPDYVGVTFEVTAAEVRTAQAILRPRTRRSAQGRTWDAADVSDAFLHLLDGRGYPRDLVRPLAGVVRAWYGGDESALHAPQALNALFEHYCIAIGVAWDDAARQFTRASPGRGRCAALLMPAWDEARLLVQPQPLAAAVATPAVQ